jgi:hypothetical protein
MAHSFKPSRLASAKDITGNAAFGSTQDCAKERASDEMSFASDRSQRKLTCVWFSDVSFSPSWATRHPEIPGFAA